MLPTAYEIKERLSKALDDKNDVDDATVVEMVTILEKYPITRSTLEETRIGKMVNDLRRKIKNEKLAKRVKQLVRNWKQILDATAPANGSPGQVHPSPAVSPALGRNASASCLVSPALNRKGISPGLAAGRPVTPTAAVVSSPALAAGRPKASLSVSGKMASPALPGRVVSPAVGRCVASPAISDSIASPSLSGRVASPSISGRVVSPAVGRMAPKVQPSPLVAGTPVHSPNLRTTTPGLGKKENSGSSYKYNVKGKTPVGSDSTNGACKLTPSFFCSENSQDKMTGDAEHGRIDSDSESTCSSKTGHSRGGFTPFSTANASLSKSSNRDSGQDQREVSKTNVANRKRTRDDKLETPPDGAEKKAKTESVVSFSGHKPDRLLNGCVSKPSRKDIPHVSSTSSLPAYQKTALSPIMSNEDHPLHLSHSEIFLRQASSDSRMSDRSVRDKNKVKTTEQLIEELQKKNSCSAASNIMTKLRTNQIEKETEVPESPLPIGVRQRGKRGRRSKNEIIQSVPSSDLTLSQAKNEHVARFLKSSDPLSLVEEDSPFRDDMLPDPRVAALGSRLELGACGGPYTKDNFDNSFSASRQDRSESAPKDESSMDASSPPLPSTLRAGSGLTLQEIEALLPPIDTDVDWDAVDFYELPESLPVTDKDVNRLHGERIPGVNGIYDINGGWTKWQHCVSLPSYEGNMLHILPYVDLDN